MKIVETIVEPNKIEVGTKFKLKVKVIEYLTYSEIKNLSTLQLKKYSTKQLKGERDETNWIRNTDFHR